MILAQHFRKSFKGDNGQAATV